jgi:hypothetical protein
MDDVPPRGLPRRWLLTRWLPARMADDVPRLAKIDTNLVKMDIGLLLFRIGVDGCWRSRLEAQRLRQAGDAGQVVGQDAVVGHP